MRRLLLSLSLLFIHLASMAFDRSNLQMDSALTKQQKENLFVLAKTWGFIKYHHPEVAKGKINFDRELFQLFHQVTNALNAEKRSELLIVWIRGLGDENSFSKADPIPVNEVLIKPDLNWINDKNLFSDELTAKLNNIYLHRNSGTNAYVKLMPNVGNPNFDGEEKYLNMTADDDGLRMLALFRYWNIIEYYFPSKYLIKEKWNDVLKEFIPQFAANRTTIGYKLTCLKLINRIHDTHANIFGDKDIDNWFGNKYPVVRLTVAEGKIIVKKYYNDSLSLFEKVKPGDEIMSVNGKGVFEIKKEKESYLCASNETVANRNFVNNVLLRSNEDSMAVTIKRDGQLINTYIKLYPPAVAYNNKTYYQQLNMYHFINDSIGYITLAVIKKDSLKKIFKAFEGTKGLIIDIRNYPSEFMPFEMGYYLKPAASPFVKFTYGNISHPGVFTFMKSISNGSNNKGYYKGKIVLLVNESTQSQAEYTTMALRTAPGAIVMGSQTAGADGNVSTVWFPGGFGSWISGIGVYYPDGKATQGIGIVPDIEVKRTPEGIKKGKDEELDKAIQYISKNN